MNRYLDWYNEHRPHASLGGRTPDEAWNGIDLPEPFPICAAYSNALVVQVHRHAYRGDPALPVVILEFDRKEAG